MPKSPPDGEQACGTCRFWHWTPEGTPAPGKCQRHAPITKDQRIQVWPETYRHQWCGDYEVWRAAGEPVEPVALSTTEDQQRASTA